MRDTSRRRSTDQTNVNISCLTLLQSEECPEVSERQRETRSINPSEELLIATQTTGIKPDGWCRACYFAILSKLRSANQEICPQPGLKACWENCKIAGPAPLEEAGVPVAGDDYVFIIAGEAQASCSAGPRSQK
jgi:hypothetical protein